MLLVLALPALGDEWPSATQSIAWPTRNGPPLPRDAIVYVIDHEPGQPDPRLVTGEDVPVAHTVHLLEDTWGRTWRVLVPDDELVPGQEYALQAGIEQVSFEVEDRVADPVEPPGPYRRERTAGCDGDRLEYRVCGGGVVHLVATGVSEPPAPTLEDPGDALVGSIGEEPFDVPVDTWPVTVWVGDLDEAGRFSGWWPADTAERPAEGLAVDDGPAGTAATTGTLTSVPSCPAFTGWEELRTFDCGPTELVTKSGGCRSVAPSAPAAALVALVALSFPWGSGSRRSRTRSRPARSSR